VKVFISWSGEPSRSIAKILEKWLRSIVQHAEPWSSDEQIKSGVRWRDEIGKALDGTDYGIICVMRSNQHAPWLMFEAGALAKRLVGGRVVPLCIDMPPSDLTGPLEDFQARFLDRGDMKALVHDVSDVCSSPMSDQAVDELFDLMWPGFEEQVTGALREKKALEKPRRSDDDMLAELVERVRRIERGQSPRIESGEGITFVPTEDGAFTVNVVETSQTTQQHHRARVALDEERQLPPAKPQSTKVKLD
jgi:TIR domain